MFPLSGILTVILAGLVHIYGMQWLKRTVDQMPAEDKERLKKPLPDFVHRRTPNLRHLRWIADNINTAMIATELGTEVVLFFLGNDVHFNFLLIVIGVVYILRTACCVALIIPQCDEYEEPLEETLRHYHHPSWPNVFNRLRKQWFVMQNGATRHELTVSGHVVMVVSILWHWTLTPSLVSGWWLVPAWLLFVLMATFIVLARNHYLLDVILGFYLASTTYFALFYLTHCGSTFQWPRALCG